MVTTWAQVSDQTELESQLYHFPASRHGEEKTYNLLPLLESEAPRRTSTTGCREQGEHQQRVHQVPGTALSLSSRMFCSIILTSSPTRPQTAQENRENSGNFSSRVPHPYICPMIPQMHSSPATGRRGRCFWYLHENSE